MEQPLAARMADVAYRFIDAFNRRDADGLVALADPGIVFRPSSLVGDLRVYHGHVGLRQWVSDLDASAAKHKARVREVRVLDDTRFFVRSEVLLYGQIVSPSAMLAQVASDGRIVEAHSYLSDEEMLSQIGLLPRSGSQR